MRSYQQQTKFAYSLFQFSTEQKKVSTQFLKKFYKSVSVEQQQNKQDITKPLWQIKLDGRNIRTPSRKFLALPHLDLAHLIAHEFNMQREFIRPPTMPLLQMARNAIDVADDVKLKEYLEKSIVDFLENDTLLFREEPHKKLYKIQCEILDPVIQNFNQKYGFALEVNEGLEVKPLSDVDKKKILDMIRQLNSWDLASLQNKAENLKSTILALSLSDEEIDVADAVQYSRLEELYQIKIFGLVEGHHDVDESNVLVNTTAAQLFSQLTKIQEATI